MEKRRLGTSSIEISPIIMGTWQAGKTMWTGIEDDQIIDALRAAFDAGITTFDTAEVYGAGYSEQMIAKALGDVRSEITLLSKVFPNHFRYDQVIEACHRSLENLKTDHLDLYQLHWPSGTWDTEVVPMQETLHAMADLKHQGKIRSIGVSNFSRAQMEEAEAFTHIDSLQPPYSLFWRFVEEDAMGFCVEHGRTVLAYSPLAQGILTGKFGPDHMFEEGDHRSGNKLFQPEHYKRCQNALNELRPIAAAYNATLTQLTLAWLIAQPQTCAIAGARNAEQIQGSAKAGSLKISAADLAEIDRIGKSVTQHLEPSAFLWDF